MKHNPLERFAAVKHIAQNRETERRKVNANLMGATSERRAFNEKEAVVEPSRNHQLIDRSLPQNLKFRAGGKPAVLLAHPAPLCRLTFRADSTERKIDGKFFAEREFSERIFGNGVPPISAEIMSI